MIRRALPWIIGIILAAVLMAPLELAFMLAMVYDAERRVVQSVRAQISDNASRYKHNDK